MLPFTKFILNTTCGSSVNESSPCLILRKSNPETVDSTNKILEIARTSQGFPDFIQLGDVALFARMVSKNLNRDIVQI